MVDVQLYRLVKEWIQFVDTKFGVHAWLCDIEACTHAMDVHMIGEMKSAMDCLNEIDCADIVADLLQLCCREYAAKLLNQSKILQIKMELSA